MRYLRFLVGCVFSIVTLYNSDAQSILKGKILDKSDTTALPFVSVILYQYGSTQILGYIQSDVDGNYLITIPSELTVLTLKTSRLGYQSLQQDIVFGSEKDTTLLLDLALQPKAEELEEVVVQGPVIVKEDTIIYDVSRFTQERDQTLEAVLAKIPGFKIRGDGEIEINGKGVQKVLINGEEVSDAGAALITRSIAPEDVENIEVRLDEKNAKLKESLLDATEYVVLDIKLKDDLKKSLFGKVRATTGYQIEVELGGYLNAFSLKEKSKIHVFAEHDVFGEQTISLRQIRNLGSEAFQKLFELPADFETLTEREAFNDELYGFKDYTIAQKDIIGISTKFSVSPSIDIYFGSYNSYSKDGKGRTFSQEFTDFDFSQNFLETQELTDYSSKNKLDFRFDNERWKIKLDVNAIFFDNQLTTSNTERTNNLNYQFDHQHQSVSFYENLLAEYKISERTGIQLKASHSVIDSDHDKVLNHNDSSYQEVFTDDTGQIVFDLQQLTFAEASNSLSEIALHHRSKLGALNVGLFYQSQELFSEKQGFNTESSTFLSNFTGEERLHLQTNSFFLGHQLSIGRFSWQAEGRWMIYSYPRQNFDEEEGNLMATKAKLTYTPSGQDYITASFNRRLSPYPLSKLMPGSDLASFQTVMVPELSAFSPQPETTFELAAGKKFQQSNIFINPALLYGQINNADRYLFTKSSVISIAYDQLKAHYLLLTLQLTKDFKTFPLSIKIEPEWVIDQNQNSTDTGELYNTRTTRSFFGMKLNTQFEERPYDLFIYPKYSSFVFTNDLTDDRSFQEMLSLDLSVDLDFFDKKFLITPYVRTIRFFGEISSNFTNVSLKADYKTPSLNWFLTVDNLLDDSDFVRQTIYPTYFISEQNFVFNRYLKVGVEYKFKE